MRIYHAGVANYGMSYPELMMMLERKEVYTLESFWYRARLEKAFERYPTFKIFLDSGAYSWDHQMTMQGKTVTEEDEIEYLNSYIRFIKKYEDRLYVYANLDFVGDPEKTMMMQERMEAAGLNPLPVFHYHGKQGDPNIEKVHFKYLERLVEKYDYIALGGGVSGGLFSYKYMSKFGDAAFKIIDSCGRDVKIHGFGLTSVPVMLRYNWFSVDSTNWIKSAAFGIVYIPVFDHKTGEAIYDKIPKRLCVSEIGRVKDTVAGHYSHTYVGDKETIEKIHNYFNSIDIDMKKMETESLERVRANFKYFDAFLKNRNEFYPKGVIDKRVDKKLF